MTVEAIIMAVIKGELDDSLDNIVQVIRERKQQVSRLVTMFIKVGDEVRFSDTIRPKCLIGLTATVVKINPQTIVVSCPNDPAYGRFQGHGRVKCPKSLIAGAA